MCFAAQKDNKPGGPLRRGMSKNNGKDKGGRYDGKRPDTANTAYIKARAHTGKQTYVLTMRD